MKKLSSYASDETITAAHAAFLSGLKTEAFSARFGVPYMTLRHQWKMRGLPFSNRRRIAAPFNPPSSAAQRAYMAGVFDGEGSISKTGTKWVVSVYQSDARLIDWLARHGGYTGLRLACRANLHAKGIRSNGDLRYWCVSKQACVARFLRCVLPFLIVKREKAQTALGELLILRAKHRD